MPQALPGTRWIRRNGKHAGAEVEIDRVTDTAVHLRDVGGGAAQGKQKIDPSQLHRMTLGSFKVTYTAKKDLANGDSLGGGFRRRGTKPQPLELPSASPPLQLNGYVLAGKSELNIEVLEISPEMARAWLDRGGINRKPSARLVARIAAAIRRGEWILTGDSIKLDDQQRVVDGQHRLLGIIEAGISVTSLVVRNVANEAQDVIDTGRSRQANDVLAMHGYVSTTALASTAKLLMLLERFGRINVSSREANLLVSNAAVLRYVQRHKELIEAVRTAERLRGNGNLGGGGGLLGAFITLIRRVDTDAAEWFIVALESGANLDANSPILKLRTRLLAERHGGRGSGVKLPNARETLLALCLKAWNAWRTDTPVQMLIWRDREDFPVAV